jgi:Tfp pilus assembly protein PilO
MNDLFQDGRTITESLLGILMTIIAWIGKRHVKRIDQLQERQQELENSHSELVTSQKDFVSRSELKAELKDMREERRQMHTENQDTLKRIHERVDALWKNIKN